MRYFSTRKITLFYLGCKNIFIAITHYKELNVEDLEHFIDIEPVIDRLLLRTPMDSVELELFLNVLMNKGFPKDKLIIHSDVRLLESLRLNAIHFKENNPMAYAYKARHPETTVSMSTHSMKSISEAKENGLDHVFFGHVFESASKKGVPPRSLDEMERAAEMNIPVMAIGGINQHTIGELPDGFSGICAISLFMDHNLEEIRAVRRAWYENV
ncbi:thiamine phosphate synthase [Salinicoccus roseus]|nr:thiamine phosphate synthase [Salinicoccus roseus]MBY8909938.1 thiamine phosphate synthase [Salinicoccus roseus]